MRHNMDIRSWIVFGLVILHIGWIGNHVRLVANDQIDPWRLGGYGMYTIPSPYPRFEVFDPNFLEIPLPVKTLRYEAADRTNPRRVFRCVHVSSASLRGFFDENRNLIGRNLVFIFSERRFFHTPPSTKREKQGEVIVTWQSARTFTYTSRFCGKELARSVTLS